MPAVLLLATQGAPAPVSTNRLTLGASVRTIQPGKPFQVGFRLTPGRGWHTYWMNCGDTGAPTDVVWNLPKGWKAGTIVYPVPEKITIAGLVNFGYEKPTLLVQTVTPPAGLKPGPVQLKGKVRWLTCTPQTCVPAKGDFNLTLQASDSAPERNLTWAPQIAEAVSNTPPPLKGFSASASLSHGVIDFRITGAGQLLTGKGEPYLFPFDDGVVNYSKPQTYRFTATGLVAELPVSEYANHPPTHLRGVLEAPPGAEWSGSHTAVTIDVPISSIKEIHHG